MRYRTWIILLLVIVVALMAFVWFNGKNRLSKKAKETAKPAQVIVSDDATGISITVPLGWIRITNADLETAEPNNKDVKELTDIMLNPDKRQFIVACLVKHPLYEKSDDRNPYIIVAAEEYGPYREIAETPIAYLKIVSDAIKKSAVKSAQISEVTGEDINGVNYAVLNIGMQVDSQPIIKRLYVTIKNNYIISVTLSASDEQSLNDMSLILKSIGYK